MSNHRIVRSGAKPGAEGGFSLIEVAVVMFIIVLLLGSILVPLTTQVEQRQISDTQKTLEEIREALVGYAFANGYLPCPAISATNGLEDRTGTSCTGNKRQGFVSWETLGTSKLDAWGHVFRYSVTPAYAFSGAPSSAEPKFGLTTSSDITIQTRNAAGALTNLTSASSVPVMVMSHGKNGYGSVNADNVAQALPAGWAASNVDENTNAAGTTTFVSRTIQSAGAGGTGGEFDDIVVWLSRYTLFNRMVSAGKLP